MFDNDGLRPIAYRDDDHDNAIMNFPLDAKLLEITPEKENINKVIIKKKNATT